ncbi:FeoA domain protein [anaerobic digester metagenome]
MTAIAPLPLLPPGLPARVHEVRGPQETKGRLSALGLLPEAEVTIVSAGHGSLIVSVAGSRYALSRGVAMQVLVSGGEPSG